VEEGCPERDSQVELGILLYTYEAIHEQQFQSCCVGTPHED